MNNEKIMKTAQMAVLIHHHRLLPAFWLNSFDAAHLSVNPFLRLPRAG